MYYSKSKNPFKKAANQILEVLRDNRDLFMADEKALSSIMKIYNELTYAGRSHPKQHLDAFDNPKYPFEVFLEKDEPFYDQVFDAWAYWVTQTEDFYRSGAVTKTELEKKVLKTPEEYVQMKLDPNYQYSKMFSSKWSVYNYLFNLFGTGLEWKDGHLVQDSAINEKWANPPELPESILSQLTTLKSKAISEGKKAYQDQVKKHHESYTFLLQNLDRQPDAEKIIEELVAITREQAKGEDCSVVENHFKSYLEKRPSPYDHLMDFTPKYSPILTMPKNVHPSYVRAALEWCEHLSTAKDVPASLKKQAQHYLKKNKAV